MLPGPLPAGNHELYISGYQAGGDAMLHAEVYHRRKGQADVTLLAVDSNVGRGSDAGTVGMIIGSFPALGAPSASCGDLLVLKVTLVSGSSGYIEIGASMTIP